MPIWSSHWRSTISTCRSRLTPHSGMRISNGRARSSSRSCVMPVDVKISVTDARPLITLAAAQGLDYLLYPALPVIIPDAVYYEATGSAGKLGAQRIIDWYRANEEVVRIEPADAFQNAVTLVTLSGG